MLAVNYYLSIYVAKGLLEQFVEPAMHVIQVQRSIHLVENCVVVEVQPGQEAQ